MSSILLQEVKATYFAQANQEMQYVKPLMILEYLWEAYINRLKLLAHQAKKKLSQYHHGLQAIYPYHIYH